MYADETHEAGRRGRQESGRTTRDMEGRFINPERTDQLVLGDVGYDNDRRGRLQIIRE